MFAAGEAGGVMFGINDNNQNDNSKAAVANGHSPLPPSPFADRPEITATDDPLVSSGEGVSIPPALPAVPATPASSDDGLVSLKEQALSNLAPLVNHLDQTPEEKFKTIMMLIQASDNSQLVGQAYEAANKIPDEKTRAQALLDVVNEINYFTKKDK